MVISWSQFLFSSPETPSQVLSQSLCYNNYIKIEDAVINFEKYLIKISTSYRSYLKMAGYIMGQSQRYICID